MRQKKTKQNKLQSQITPSIDGAREGMQRIQRAAFPLQREMAHFWKRWRVESAGGIPKRWPGRRTRQASVSTAEALIFPSVSKTSGKEKKVSESLPHSCLCTFKCFPQPQAVPPYLPSHAPQPLPLRQREALIAPSLHSTKLGDHLSE